MKAKIFTAITVMFILAISCQPKEKKINKTKYTSAITFLYYEDFSYGIDFMEKVLELELIKDDGFARVYAVNDKAFLGIVQARDQRKPSGSTLFSLTTTKVEAEYERVKQLEVYDLTEIKYFESIPLKSFFFYDNEEHHFEIQQFLDEDDQQRF